MKKSPTTPSGPTPDAAQGPVEAAYDRAQKVLAVLLFLVSLLSGGTGALVVGGETAAAVAVVGVLGGFVFGMFLLLLVVPGAFTVVAVVRGHRRKLPWGLVAAGTATGLLLPGLGLLALAQDRSGAPLTWIGPLAGGTLLIGLLTLGALATARPRGWGSASPGLPGVLLAGFILGFLLVASGTFRSTRPLAYQAAVRAGLEELDRAQRSHREQHPEGFTTSVETLALDPPSRVRLEIVRADREGYGARGVYEGADVGPCAVFRGGQAYQLAPAVEPGRAACLPLEAEVGFATVLGAGLIAAYVLAGVASWVVIGGAADVGSAPPPRRAGARSRRRTEQ